MLLILVIIFFIYKIPKIDLESIIVTFNTGNINVKYIIIAFGLVFVNYFFEIKKWQLLVKNLEQRDYLAATKDILLGSAAGLITPFMLGDFAGRTHSFSTQNTPKALILNAFNSFSQTWVAMTMGLLALIIHQNKVPLTFLKNNFLIGFGCFCFVSLILLLHTSVKKKLGSFLPERLQKILLVDISMNVKLSVIILTICRNFTYVIQYTLLFAAMSINLDFQTIFTGISLVLFAKTLGLGLNVLGEISIRSILSVQFFENYGVSSVNILSITFVIWIFNVILPAFIGATIPLLQRKK